MVNTHSGSNGMVLVCHIRVFLTTRYGVLSETYMIERLVGCGYR